MTSSIVTPHSSPSSQGQPTHIYYQDQMLTSNLNSINQGQTVGCSSYQTDSDLVLKTNSPALPLSPQSTTQVNPTYIYYQDHTLTNDFNSITQSQTIACSSYQTNSDIDGQTNYETLSYPPPTINNYKTSRQRLKLMQSYNIPKVNDFNQFPPLGHSETQISVTPEPSPSMSPSKFSFGSLSQENRSDNFIFHSTILSTSTSTINSRRQNVHFTEDDATDSISSNQIKDDVIPSLSYVLDYPPPTSFQSNLSDHSLTSSPRISSQLSQSSSIDMAGYNENSYPPLLAEELNNGQTCCKKSYMIVLLIVIVSVIFFIVLPTILFVFLV